MTMRHSTTVPAESDRVAGRPVVAVTPYWTAPDGATYVHRDLERVTEAHQIAPVKAEERFGDVESWAAYVKGWTAKRVDGSARTFLATWNGQGVRAVLDYHTPDGTPDRCGWVALYPFVPSVEWAAWAKIANDRPMGQLEAINVLENQGDDIVEPEPTRLLAILRNLRASVNSTAQTELQPDGGSTISFTQVKSVKPLTVDIPAEFEIAIPVLRAHMNAEGKPVKYKLDVRVRPSVGDQAQLAFRFRIQNAERVLDEVHLERVTAAQAALGDSPRILRAAD